MAVKSGVTVTRDGLKAMLANVKMLTGQEVMVGVPEEDPKGNTPGPNDRKGGAINNAALAYIHEHGAPEANIPARPFLAPGVESAKAVITAQMKAAGTAAMDGKPAGIEKALNAAGLAAQNGARAAITDGADFEPLTPAAALSRMRRRSGVWAKYLKADADQKSDMIEAELSGAKPLIDSGQLRASLSYVIRKK